jgi:hypothetical protein
MLQKYFGDLCEGNLCQLSLSVRVRVRVRVMTGSLKSKFSHGCTEVRASGFQSAYMQESVFEQPGSHNAS